MEKLQYVCPKCGCTQYESDLVTVSCVNCGYTELYKAQSSDGWNILDFLVGN